MRTRIAVSLLAVSASMFVALIQHEGYTDKAVIPVKGDVWTVGIGSTTREDGTPVQMGDTTTPVRAIVRAAAHIGAEEERFRASLPGVALHQAEYDLYLDFLYQYGSGAWGKSDMRRELLKGNHRAACDALREYRFMTSPTPIKGFEPYKFDARGKPIRWRFDCSTPGNRVCAGVWTRQKERIEKCLAAQ